MWQSKVETAKGEKQIMEHTKENAIALISIVQLEKAYKIYNRRHYIKTRNIIVNMIYDITVGTVNDEIGLLPVITDLLNEINCVTSDEIIKEGREA